MRPLPDFNRYRNVPNIEYFNHYTKEPIIHTTYHRTKSKTNSGNTRTLTENTTVTK